MRILSGIQPSGALHIGNYFGALKQFIDLQHDNDAYYFVADYHALTSVRDAAALRGVYVRRDRHDAVAGPRSREGDSVRSVGRAGNDRAGLAALDRDTDGLAGEVRQLQGQDRAGAARRARPLRLPGACRRPTSCSTTPTWFRSDRTRSSTSRSPATSPSGSTASTAAARTCSGCPSRTSSSRWPSIPGLDGRKMSKSYNNTIDIFDDPATIRKKAKKIVTDSTPVEAPKNPDTCPFFNLFKLFAAADDRAEVETRYREGGIGYGEVKTRLAEAIIARFAPARELRADWLAHPERVAEVRAAAAARAKATARVVLDRARAACGVG